MIEDWLNLPVAQAAERAQLGQQRPEMASTLALLPDPAEGQARQALRELILTLAAHPAGRPVGPELAARAESLRRQSRLGDLLEIVLHAAGQTGQAEDRLTLIRGLVERGVELRSLALVLPRLVQHPRERLHTAAALGALADFTVELRKGGDAADEQLLAERWHTISSSFPELGGLLLPGQGGRVEVRGELARRRDEMLTVLSHTAASVAGRAPTLEGDEALLSLDTRALEGSSWRRWLELRARIEEARDRKARITPLLCQASPQEMLEARRIAGIDAKSYLPPTIQGRLTSASAVMDDIHRLLLCLSTSPDDEEALLRIEEGYRDPGRPRERAQAWERAIENELAPGRGTLKQRLLLARERKAFVKGVLALHDHNRAELRREAERWISTSSLAGSTYVRQRVGTRLMHHLSGQLRRANTAMALGALLLLLLLLPQPLLAETSSGDAAWLEGNDALARELWQRRLTSPNLPAAERDRLCANLRWDNRASALACSEVLIAECSRAGNPVLRLSTAMSSALPRGPRNRTPLKVRESPSRMGKELGTLPLQGCFCALPTEDQVRRGDGWVLILADSGVQSTIRGWSLLDRMEEPASQAACPMD